MKMTEYVHAGLRGLLAVVATSVMSGTAIALELVVDQDRELTEEEKAYLNGDGKNAEFIKRGTGVLTVDGINSFRSTITVAEGTVRVVDRSGLGAERPAVTAVNVLSGARLNLAISSTSEGRLFGRSIQIAGDGLAGESNGALNLSAHAGITKLILAADASISGSLRCIEDKQAGFTSTIDMSGSTLTFLSGDQRWRFSTLTRPGNIRLMAGEFRLSGGCGLTGGDGCEFEACGGLLSLYDWRAPFTWTLRFTSSTSILHAGGGTDIENSNVFSGPVVIDEGVVAEIKNGNDANFAITFANSISGAGTLKMSSKGRIRLLANDNVYTGSIVVNNSNVTLYAPNSGSLSRDGEGAVNFPVLNDSSDAIVLGARTATETHGWSAGEVESFIAHYGAGKIRLVIGDGETFVYDRPVTNGFPECMGDGRAAFTGGVTGYPNLTLRGATFANPADGSSLQLGNVKVTGGTVSFTDTRMDWSSSAPAVASSVGTAPIARMVLESNTVCTAGNNFRVARTSDTVGVVEIRPDALVTNNMFIGTDSGACGAVYHAGGTVVETGDVWWGADGGFGYYELSGGMLESEWIHSVGRIGGTGIFYQKGGRFVKGTYPLCLGYSGTAVVYQTSGILRHTKTPMQLGEMRWLTTDSSRSMASFVNYTVSGVATTEVSFVDGARHPNMDVYMNINDGGTLFADGLRKNSTLQSGVTSPEITNNKFYVNFNGGTLKSRNSSRTELICSSAEKAPDRVTVYGKGAIFDIGIAGYDDLELSVPLQAPGDGIGVTNIAWNPVGGYIAPPLVVIEGDGRDATAIAEFDSGSGMVTGIVVTSPGWGYTSATAVLTGGGVPTSVSVPCTLGNIMGGGVTKCGTGRLVLNAVNTYAGPTVIKAGTLVQGVQGAIPSGTELLIQQGATLDLNDLAVTFTGIGGTGGRVTNGAVALVGNISMSAQKFIERQTTAIDGDIDLSGVTRFTLTDAEVLTEEAETLKSMPLVSAASIKYPATPFEIVGEPRGWKVVCTSTAIKLQHNSGMIFVFR